MTSFTVVRNNFCSSVDTAKIYGNPQLRRNGIHRGSNIIISSSSLNDEALQLLMPRQHSPTYTIFLEYFKPPCVFII
ncbi:hypothetical protein CW304_02125 [Bacillus sp. UFRGS-B20]|nr:hypothetical protein CW304_02125 [Bacillus sp. UFRGS-B20]